jgi:hypothetical protein
VIEALQLALSGIVYPHLVEGARRGPPEDIGGPPGYAEFLKGIADPKHERHAELTEWSGEDFDPEGLSIDDVNVVLAQLAKPKRTRLKKLLLLLRIRPARKHRGFHRTLAHHRASVPSSARVSRRQCVQAAGDFAPTTTSGDTSAVDVAKLGT